MQGSDAKEEVRARLNIEDVIGEYVELKRAGRNFKGLSPFTAEKTPSFFVSPEKHIWHDFSSNKGGDVFSFVMEVEGLEFRASLEHLARKAGVDLTMYDSKKSGEIAQKKKRLLEAHRQAARYYQASLLQNTHALDYVTKKRGLRKQTIEDFQIGYAPTSGDALVQFLTKKGFTAQELKQGGLTNRYGGDLFRGRMMVPLMDATGQVIGFTARIIKDDPGAPKYLNTPQTLLYDKGRHVFGLSQAKEAIRGNDYAVIVEGNLDVVSSHQVDIKQVVATAGTAMTEHHLKSLSRLTHSVRLSFDGDKAGIAATERAIPIASRVGVELAIVTLPGEAKDPDELIAEDPKLWQHAIETTVPAAQWLIEQYQAREDLSTAAGKRAFTSATLRTIASIEDTVEREHYERMVAELTNTTLEALRSKEARDKEQAQTPRKRIVAQPHDIATDSNAYQDTLLALLLIDAPSQALLKQEHVSRFATEERKAIAAYLLAHSGTALTDIPASLREIETYGKILLLKAEARYAAWSEQDRYFEAARLLRQVENEHRKQKKDLLTEQLRQAEERGDDDIATQARAELNTLIKEITRGGRG